MKTGPLVALCLAAMLGAQSNSTAKFEVASVKLSRDCGNPAGAADGRRSGGASPSPGRLHVCGPVASLIQSAYVIFADGRTNRMLEARASGPPLSGGPEWVRSDNYLIDAEPDQATSQEMMNGPMMQRLLEERFHLVLRRETREVPAYALTAVKGAAKLHPFVEGSCVAVDVTKRPNPPLPPGQQYCQNGNFRPGKGENFVFQAQGMTLDRFAGLMGWVAGRPVINRTGIEGLFDFRLEFGRDEATPTLAGPGEASDEPPGPSILTALQEQLGLKLEPARGAKEFLIIDHVERPAEN